MTRFRYPFLAVCLASALPLISQGCGGVGKGAGSDAGSSVDAPAATGGSGGRGGGGGGGFGGGAGRGAGGAAGMGSGGSGSGGSGGTGTGGMAGAGGRGGSGGAGGNPSDGGSRDAPNAPDGQRMSDAAAPAMCVPASQCQGSASCSRTCGGGGGRVQCRCFDGRLVCSDCMPQDGGPGDARVFPTCPREAATGNRCPDPGEVCDLQGDASARRYCFCTDERRWFCL